jgi:hypothetical protein
MPKPRTLKRPLTRKPTVLDQMPDAIKNGLRSRLDLCHKRTPFGQELNAKPELVEKQSRSYVAVFESQA